MDGQGEGGWWSWLCDLVPLCGGHGTGRVRLAGELDGFRKEFECFASEVSGDDPCWVERGRELLADAEAALEDGNVEEGWYNLHATKRLALSRYETDEDGEGRRAAIRAEGRALLVEADNATESWRTDAVRSRLAEEDGTVREQLTVEDLRAARKLLDEGYQRVHLKRHHLQKQLGHLRNIALVSVALFVAVALLSGNPTARGGFLAADWMVHPLVDLPTNESVVTNQSVNETGVDWHGAGVPPGFLVYVVLAGVIGAALFGIRTLRKRPTSASTPQHLSSFQASMARVVVGAGSALAAFLFLSSGLLQVGGGVEENRAALLLGVAFAAGYSERLVHATVESVAGAGETEDDDSGGGS